MTIEEIFQEISSQKASPAASNTLGAASLDQIASVYEKSVINHWEKLYEKKAQASVNFMQPYFPSVPGAIGLELGCADGAMTEKLLKHFSSFHVLDGSLTFLKQAEARLSSSPSTSLTFHHSLFEEFSTAHRFDAIFMAHVLEHLDDPVTILKKFRSFLKPNGRLFALVPNANSLHRYAGVRLGLLSQRTDLNSQDLLVGHRRVYTPALMRAHLQESGYNVLHFGGVMIKPLSNRQLEEQWSPELIQAFIDMGHDLPELSSEIFFVCESAHSQV